MTRGNNFKDLRAAFDRLGLNESVDEETSSNAGTVWSEQLNFECCGNLDNSDGYFMKNIREGPNYQQNTRGRTQSFDCTHDHFELIDATKIEVGINQNLSCLSNSYETESSYETVSQCSITITEDRPDEKKTVENDIFSGVQTYGSGV